jgi:hypothetical protein
MGRGRKLLTSSLWHCIKNPIPTSNHFFFSGVSARDPDCGGGAESAVKECDRAAGCASCGSCFARRAQVAEMKSAQLSKSSGSGGGFATASRMYKYSESKISIIRFSGAVQKVKSKDKKLKEQGRQRKERVAEMKSESKSSAWVAVLRRLRECTSIRRVRFRLFFFLAQCKKSNQKIKIKRTREAKKRKKLTRVLQVAEMKSESKSSVWVAVLRRVCEFTSVRRVRFRFSFFLALCKKSNKRIKLKQQGKEMEVHMG